MCATLATVSGTPPRSDGRVEQLGEPVPCGGRQAVHRTVGPQDDHSRRLRVKQLVGLELIGFLIIFTCMILMRFGL